MVLKSGDISWLLLRLILFIPTSLVWSAVLDDYPQRNMVAFFNGGCEEHICEYKCIPWNGGYVCRCPEGKILKSNGFSCHDVPNLESKSTRTPLPTTDKNVLPQRDEVYIEGGLLGRHDSRSSLSDEISAKPSLKSSTNLSSDKPVNSTVFKNVTTYRDGSPQNQTSYGVKIQPYNLRSGMSGPVEISQTHQESKLHVRNDNEVALEKVHPKLANIKVQLPPKECRGFTCRNGGYCSVDPSSGLPRCNCPLGTRGKRCGKDVEIRYPKFKGDGYLTFPVLRNAYKGFTITIQFKPDDTDGLLLFSSEKEDASGDFFSIALINGHINFRFDCGTGMAVFNSVSNVTLGEWNYVWAQRVDNHGWLKLNEEMPIEGAGQGNYTRITLREDLYLGGYKEMQKVSGRVGTHHPFTGCVEELWVNSYKYDMRRAGKVGDAIHGLNIDECSINVCGEIQCENGGQCMARSADKHVCLCPMGTAGTLCQSRVDVHIPSFDGHSYIQYEGLHRTTLTYTEIEIILKPKYLNGLILYNGYTTDRKGDFIALLMREGHVEFSFDLGTGPAVLRSHEPVSLNEWHVVKVYRTGMDGVLEVDDQEKVEALSKGAYTQLTLLLELFVGGHKNFDHLSKHVNISDGFRGCIQKVVINGKPLKLTEEAQDGVNIDNCQHPCVGQPCMNGGLCEPIQDLYSCNCPLGYTNTNCEEIVGKQITVPKFQRSSYLKFVNPNIIKRVAGKKIDIQMHIQTSDQNGLLFWSGQEPATPSSDFLALGFNEGVLQFRFNLGSGEAVIQHNTSQLTDGNVHVIHARRVGQDAYLSIDGTEIYEGSSPGKYKYLNTNSELYIGGMQDVAHRTRRRFTTGFTGCIYKLILATDYEVNLIGQTDSGSNVSQCG